MVTRRLGKGIFKVLGVEELPVLLATRRLAYLYMNSAHFEDHKGAKITLWRSRSKVWVHQGYKLAQRCERECNGCTLQKKLISDQRMGDLPQDRFDIGTPPWYRVCLDLMGPVEVKGVPNIQTRMKVWHLL